MKRLNTNYIILDNILHFDLIYFSHVIEHLLSPKKKLGKKWNWLTPGDHLKFFTPDTLAKVLFAGGFIPFKVKCWTTCGIFFKCKL